MNKNELVSHVAAETSATRATAERMVGVSCSPPSATRCAGRVRRHRRIRDVPHPRPCRAPGSQSENRGARRHHGLEGAVVQGGEGPSRRGQRIAWRAKRPGAGRSSRQRRRDRCTPSPYLRDEALGLEAGSFPCACVRPIDEPALHASRGRLTHFTPRAVGLASGRIRWAVERLWQGGDVGISSLQTTVRTSAQCSPAHRMLPERRLHNIGRCELAPTTAIHTHVHATYSTGSCAAYGHNRSLAGTQRCSSTTESRVTPKSKPYSAGSRLAVTSLEAPHNHHLQTTLSFSTERLPNPNCSAPRHVISNSVPDPAHWSSIRMCAQWRSQNRSRRSNDKVLLPAPMTPIPTTARRPYRRYHRYVFGCDRTRAMALRNAQPVNCASISVDRKHRGE